MTRSLSRIVVTGGGTAGHVFTGLAVLDEIRRRNPRAETLFLGSPHGHEPRLIPASPHAFATIDVRPLRLPGAPFQFAAFARIPAGIAAALAILRKARPEIVLGIGGAASGPALIAARLLGIPSALHEQNSLPGLANRLAAHLVTRLLVGLPQRAGAFAADARLRLTGNPVRADLAATIDAVRAGLTAPEPSGGPDDPFHILVLGGSDGSPFMNAAAPPTLIRVAENGGLHLVVRHQAGPSDLARIRAAYQHPRIVAHVDAFFGNIGAAYATAHLAMTLGGAVTLAELALAALPAVVVPLATAADDHQRLNAEHYARHGAIATLDERTFTPDEGARTIAGLLDNPAARNALGAAARSLATPHAAGLIVDALEELRDAGGVISRGR